MSTPGEKLGPSTEDVHTVHKRAAGPDADDIDLLATDFLFLAALLKAYVPTVVALIWLVVGGAGLGLSGPSDWTFNVFLAAGWAAGSAMLVQGWLIKRLGPEIHRELTGPDAWCPETEEDWAPLPEDYVRRLMGVTVRVPLLIGWAGITTGLAILFLWGFLPGMTVLFASLAFLIAPGLIENEIGVRRVLRGYHELEDRAGEAAA